jgi:hypothetical protein
LFSLKALSSSGSPLLLPSAAGAASGELVGGVRIVDTRLQRSFSPNVDNQAASCTVIIMQEMLSTRPFTFPCFPSGLESFFF